MPLSVVPNSLATRASLSTREPLQLGGSLHQQPEQKGASKQQSVPLHECPRTSSPILHAPAIRQVPRSLQVAIGQQHGIRTLLSLYACGEARHYIWPVVVVCYAPKALGLALCAEVAGALVQPLKAGIVLQVLQCSDLSQSSSMHALSCPWGNADALHSQEGCMQDLERSCPEALHATGLRSHAVQRHAACRQVADSSVAIDWWASVTAAGVRKLCTSGNFTAAGQRGSAGDKSAQPQARGTPALCLHTWGLISVSICAVNGPLGSPRTIRSFSLTSYSSFARGSPLILRDSSFTSLLPVQQKSRSLMQGTTTGARSNTVVASASSLRQRVRPLCAVEL